MTVIDIAIALGGLFGFSLGWVLGRSWLRNRVRADLAAAIEQLRQLYGEEITLADGTQALRMDPGIEDLLRKVQGNEGGL